MTFAGVVITTGGMIITVAALASTFIRDYVPVGAFFAAQAGVAWWAVTALDQANVLCLYWKLVKQIIK